MSLLIPGEDIVGPRVRILLPPAKSHLRKPAKTAAFSVYSATKAAVRNFARSWILDLADRHIRVNAVSPGPIATPGLDGLAATEEQARQFKAGMVANIPLRRLGAPDEVAKAVVFLASDDSSFVNGAELFVDGGFAQI